MTSHSLENCSYHGAIARSPSVLHSIFASRLSRMLCETFSTILSSSISCFSLSGTKCEHRRSAISSHRCLLVIPNPSVIHGVPRATFPRVCCRSVPLSPMWVFTSACFHARKTSKSAEQMHGPIFYFSSCVGSEEFWADGWEPPRRIAGKPKRTIWFTSTTS